MFKVGCSKKEIPCFFEGLGMLGYGKEGNDVKGVETPIFCRAFVFSTKGKIMAFVNAEICFFTMPLQKAVLDQLNVLHPGMFTESNLMLTAQHSHSAPGGIAHRVFYNTSIPGFKTEVFEAYKKGVVEAVMQALKDLQPARISYHTGLFAEDIEVAFNRSLIPYNANKELSKKYTEAEAHLAVDRAMKLLRVENQEGKLTGSLNWFGVHATSVSNDNTKICSDNKGYAAEFTENQQENMVAAFAQEAAGDVTPNFVWDKKKKWLRGKFEDDFESARYNGQLQSDMALKLLASTPENYLAEEIDCHTMYFDMGNVEVAPRFAEGKEQCTTSPACIGMSFFGGTKEGPGVPRFLIRMVNPIISFGKLFEKIFYRATLPKEEKLALDRKFAAQSPKALAMELGKGRIFWVSRMSRVFFVPDFVDPLVKMFRRLGREGILDKDPWGPTVLPLQIMILGHLAIIAIPAEITTMAGRRLRKSLLDVLSQRGVTEVILSPYANAYAGYITTKEEYMHQRYEGGHTLFGKWTLAAFQTNFDILAKEMLLQKDQRKKADALTVPYVLKEENIWTGF